MTNPERDPFERGDSAPAISFKDAPVGTVRRIKIDGPARVVQSRDFATGDPLYWVPGQRGKKSTVQSDKPVESAVFNGTDPETGDEVSLWAGLPSEMFTKINEAKKAIDPKYKFKAGDEIAVRYAGSEPSGKGNDRKLYQAKVTPAPEPQPAAAADPFGDDAPPF